MPELQDIELFKRKINSLGDEEQILAERGEKIVDIPPPEQGVPDDISALLSDIADSSAAPENIPSGEELPAEEFSDDSDFTSGTGENPEEFFDTDLGEAAASEQTPLETDSFNDDLGSIGDLGSMFEDSEPEDDIALMPDELVDQGMSGNTSEFAAGFEEPEEGSEDLSGSGPEQFDQGEGLSDFPDLDTFDLPEDLDADIDSFSEGETASEESLPGEASSDEFNIPEMEDFGTGFETVSEESSADEGGADLSGIPEENISEPFAIDEGSSEFPDLDTFDLPEDLDADMDISTETAETSGEEYGIEDNSAELESSDQDFTPDDAGDFDISDLGDDFSIPETESGLPEEGGGIPLDESDEFEMPDDFSALSDDIGEAGESAEVDAGMEEGLDFDAGELDTFDISDELDQFEEPVGTSFEQDADAGLSDFDDSYSGTASDLDTFDMPEDIDTGLEAESASPDAFSAEADADFDLGSLEDISLEDELEIDTEESSSDLDDLDLLESMEEEEAFDTSSSDSEEFSLEDLGEEYSNLEEIEEEEVTVPEPAASAPDINIPEEAEESDFSIEREKIERVTETLNQLPRNLKLIIEDLIGNKGLSGRRLDNLVEKLASGASVREIASLAEKITGRKIRIPSQYERKTWAELEEEKQTFAYILKHQILPYAGKIALISVALFFTVFVLKKQVYDPLYSSYLYDKGYKQLENENYRESDRLFNKASRLRPFKKQFFRYADTYIEKREYDRAEQKYITMLGLALSSERAKSRNEQQRGYFPTNKKGFLDYAALKTFYQGEYAESDRILEDFIMQKGNKWDYDALLDKIDNFLNWGELDSKQFDSAGYVLNDSLSKFGNKPELEFRKMAYYLHSGRIDSLEEKAMSDIEKGDSKSIDVRKYYSMLGEFRNYIENVKSKYADHYMVSDFYRYMIDHDDIDGIEEKLIAVSNQDKKLIEPHYQLSRYWKRMEKKDLERRALGTIENLLKNFDDSHMMKNYPHSYNYAAMQRKRMDIFTHNRLGKFSYNDDEILEAQRYYKKAVDRFEKYSSLPGNTASYGHIYEDLGDIYYYNAGRYNDALKYFGKAYSTGYKNDNLDYKIGFINYKNRNYSKAAENFYDISLNARENEAALFAFANASFNYGVYSPAKAYYDRVIEKMEYWREHEKVLDVERRRDQREILEKLMQVYNNQGVTLFKLAEKNHNQEYYSKSLVYLSESSELYDSLMRDPLTMNKTLTKPLAQLNMKWILLNSGWKNMNYEKSVIPYSSDNMSLDSPVIYNSIDEDLYGRVNTSLK